MNLRGNPIRLCRLLLLCSVLLATSATAEIWRVDVEGAIGPATADHMIRGLAAAEAADAALVVLRIDTPGGLDNAMRDMVKAVLAAQIPVVGYVAPGGARAASAGTYILYATHLAAMAPGTNLGAATPVQMGGPGLPGTPDPQPDAPPPDAAPGDQAGDQGQAEQGSDTPMPATAMERKMVNDAVAYIRGLAELRGRNADWAEKAVRSGASLSASAALDAGVIDLVAPDWPALLASLDGRQVTVNERAVTLETEGLALYHHEVDWRSEFLAVITNPNIAYLLMLAGIYGLLIEFYNPGIGLPGVVGAVSLLLALYAFQVLPVSYAGLGLIALGVGLMTAEAFAPSFGILGLGGVVAFAVGSVMLMDTELPAYQIALPMIAAVTAFSAGLLIFALGMLMKARRGALVSGIEHLVGETVVVDHVAADEITVWLDGERWQARCATALRQGERAVVTGFDGLTVVLRKDEEGSDHV